jgi:hypothetical protein
MLINFFKTFITGGLSIMIGCLFIGVLVTVLFLLAIGGFICSGFKAFK